MFLIVFFWPVPVCSVSTMNLARMNHQLQTRTELRVRRVAGCGPAQKMPRLLFVDCVQGVFEHGTQVAAIRA